MTTSHLLLSAWHWHPSVLLGCALLVLAYCVAQRFRLGATAPAFFGGIAVLLFALLSPLHVLGDGYLFSAHMLQHLLLLLVVPPLLLAGIPAAMAEEILRVPLAGRVERLLGRPAIGWSLAIGTMWLWHLPLLYNTALAMPSIHIVEHLCFLITATIFWWPIMAPLASHRLETLPALGYLLAAFCASNVLGILLTFTPPGLYPAYLAPRDTLGIVALIRSGWGMSPAADQQLGGLLMWVPGGLVYLGAIVVVLARWYSSADDDSVLSRTT
jgi:putative membrane protein